MRGRRLRRALGSLVGTGGLLLAGVCAARASESEIAIDAVARQVAAVEALLASPALDGCLGDWTGSGCGAIAEELSTARRKLDYQRGLLVERVADPRIRGALASTLSGLSKQLVTLLRHARPPPVTPDAHDESESPIGVAE